MPTPWKVSLLFNSEQSGWSETYYTDAPDSDSAFNNGLRLFNIRQLMCPLPTKGVYLRVSEEGFKRKSILTATGPFTNYPLPFGNWNAFSDLVGTCGIGTVYASSATVQRTIYLRGLSDDCFDRSSPGNADNLQWKGLLTSQFRAELVNNTWYIKTRGGPNFVKVLSIVVSWLNQDNTSYSTMVLSAPIAGIVVGSQIILKDVSGLRPAPGAVKVLGISGDGLTLKVAFSLPEDFTYQPGATAYLYQAQYAKITSLTFTKFGHRNTGRPFGGSRGRRVKVAR